MKEMEKHQANGKDSGKEDAGSRKKTGGAEDSNAAAEAAALTGLAQWLNCQGDSGEKAELMDRLEEELPGKVERGGGLI